jgi:hypothetical protein
MSNGDKVRSAKEMHRITAGHWLDHAEDLGCTIHNCLHKVATLWIFGIQLFHGTKSRPQVLVDLQKVEHLAFAALFLRCWYSQ